MDLCEPPIILFKCSRGPLGKSECRTLEPIGGLGRGASSWLETWLVQGPVGIFLFVFFVTKQQKSIFGTADDWTETLNSRPKPHNNKNWWPNVSLRFPPDRIYLKNGTMSETGFRYSVCPRKGCIWWNCPEAVLRTVSAAVAMLPSQAKADHMLHAPLPPLVEWRIEKLTQRQTQLQFNSFITRQKWSLLPPDTRMCSTQPCRQTAKRQKYTSNDTTLKLVSVLSRQ